MNQFLLKALLFLIAAALGLGIIYGFVSLIGKRYTDRAKVAYDQHHAQTPTATNAP